MKYTTHTLKKIENVFKEGGYTLRYAKGNFGSGYCLFDKKKFIIINKLYSTEARINVLMEVLLNADFDDSTMSDATIKHYTEFLNQLEKMSIAS